MATSTPNQPPLLLSEKEAAKLMGFSKRTLQKWRTDGGGPPYVHVSSRAIRYRRRDIERWIEKRLRLSTSNSDWQGRYAGGPYYAQ